MPGVAQHVLQSLKRVCWHEARSTAPNWAAAVLHFCTDEKPVLWKSVRQLLCRVLIPFVTFFTQLLPPRLKTTRHARLHGSTFALASVAPSMRVHANNVASDPTMILRMDGPPFGLGDHSAWCDNWRATGVPKCMRGFVALAVADTNTIDTAIRKILLPAVDFLDDGSPISEKRREGFEPPSTGEFKCANE